MVGGESGCASAGKKLENFEADMGPRPVGFTLERRDNSKGYDPSNCFWASRAQQRRNTRNIMNFTYQGKTQCLQDWADELGIKFPTLYSRIWRGATFEEAIKEITLSDAKALNDSLAANYLLLELQLRSWSGKSTDREVSNEVIANKGAARGSGKFVKDLFVGADAELKEVNQLGNAIRALVYARTVPFSNNSEGAKRGDRLLSAVKSMEVLKELNAVIQDYNAAVMRLVAVYDQRVQEALSNLQGMGNPADYPDKSTIAERFAVSVDLKPVPALVDFTRVNIPSALAEALGQRHAAQAETMVANAMSDLKQRLLEQLQRMATQLNKAADGTKTRLYDSLVTNLQDLVSLTRSMNVYQNSELNALADKIEMQLLKHPVEVYRVHPKQAAVVAQAASNLAVEAALEEIWK